MVATTPSSRRARTPVRALPVADAPEAARAAGLRYVTDLRPGISRRRVGKGFVFVAPDGTRIRDTEELARIRSIAVPPAWTNVWICPRADGHVQATGRDARGRKQYRYHPDWRRVRDETKFDRMIAFGEALPALRRRVAADIEKPGLCREKVLATIVRLLDTTFMRIGNAEYAERNGSYGLTTLRDKHADLSNGRLRLEFVGKGGKRHTVDVRDRRVASIVKRCRDLPGYELFQYVDDDGERRSIDSADVNEYVRDIAGSDFTAKDFRTWAATVLAARALWEIGPFRSQAQGKRNVSDAVEAVAHFLGNTPTICRKSYVHPGILDAYVEGVLCESGPPVVRRARTVPLGLRGDERAVLRLLRKLARRSKGRPAGGRRSA